MGPRLGDTGARGCWRNKTLTALGLGANKLGGDGARHLAVALERNSTLRELYLARNNIDGVCHLAVAVERNPTLTVQ
jgi:hypothetical protein